MVGEVDGRVMMGGVDERVMKGGVAEDKVKASTSVNARARGRFLRHTPMSRQWGVGSRTEEVDERRRRRREGGCQDVGGLSRRGMFP